MNDFIDFYHGFTSLFMWMTLLILLAKHHDKKARIQKEVKEQAEKWKREA